MRGERASSDRSANAGHGRLDELRATIETDGTAAAVTIGDLQADDLDALLWVDWLHRQAVAQALARTGSGEVAYLAARSPDAQVIGKGGLDFTARRGAAVIWQLVVHPDLRGLGIGTALIAALEERARRHQGVGRAVLGVEDDNPQAAALYQRLGYRPAGREQQSWLQIGPDDAPERYETEVMLLAKPIPHR
jgi:ribosomal protein S18 acetylase RimI-like enzyme